MNKKTFLEIFDNFLYNFEDEGYAKCSFKLLNGQECQGWIMNITDSTFVYLDSGPLAREKPYIFEIENIDVKSFSYWDAEIEKWTDYIEPNKILNRIISNKKT